MADLGDKQRVTPDIALSMMYNARRICKFLHEIKFVFYLGLFALPGTAPGKIDSSSPSEEKAKFT